MLMQSSTAAPPLIKALINIYTGILLTLQVSLIKKYCIFNNATVWEALNENFNFFIASAFFS